MDRIDSILSTAQYYLKLKDLVWAARQVITDDLSVDIRGVNSVMIIFRNGQYASLKKDQCKFYLRWLREGNHGTWEDYRNRKRAK